MSAPLRRIDRARMRLGFVLDRLPGARLENGAAWLRGRPLPASAIVCGAGPGLFEEFATAREHLPDAFVIAVNDAASAVHADALVTQHPEKAARFLAASRNPAATVHTGKFRRHARHRAVQVYWPRCQQGITSGGSAVHIAYMMGFSTIVLCGLPLSGGDGYGVALAPGGEARRFGLESSQSDYVQRYRRNFVQFVESNPELRRRVRACSGLTREFFGAPTWMEAPETGERSRNGCV